VGIFLFDAEQGAEHQARNIPDRRLTLRREQQMRPPKWEVSLSEKSGVAFDNVAPTTILHRRHTP
jgi:hypothetical protein